LSTGQKNCDMSSQGCTYAQQGGQRERRPERPTRVWGLGQRKHTQSDASQDDRGRAARGAEPPCCRRHHTPCTRSRIPAAWWIGRHSWQRLARQVPWDMYARRRQSRWHDDGARSVQRAARGAPRPPSARGAVTLSIHLPRYSHGLQQYDAIFGCALFGSPSCLGSLVFFPRAHIE